MEYLKAAIVMTLIYLAYRRGYSWGYQDAMRECGK
jgi:hypothetical protein